MLGRQRAAVARRQQHGLARCTARRAGGSWNTDREHCPCRWRGCRASRPPPGASRRSRPWCRLRTSTLLRFPRPANRHDAEAVGPRSSSPPCRDSVARICVARAARPETTRSSAGTAAARALTARSADRAALSAQHGVFPARLAAAPAGPGSCRSTSARPGRRPRARRAGAASSASTSVVTTRRGPTAASVSAGSQPSAAPPSTNTRSAAANDCCERVAVHAHAHRVRARLHDGDDSFRATAALEPRERGGDRRRVVREVLVECNPAERRRASRAGALTPLNCASAASATSGGTPTCTAAAIAASAFSRLCIAEQPPEHAADGRARRFATLTRDRSPIESYAAAPVALRRAR